jgi:hypothetical protein
MKRSRLSRLSRMNEDQLHTHRNNLVLAINDALGNRGKVPPKVLRLFGKYDMVSEEICMRK